MESEKEILSSRILVVDDDSFVVSLLQTFLKGAGFTEIRSLTDSRLAMALYESFMPDLVVLDWVMPHIDGLSLLKAIRDMDPESNNVLVLTARTDRETRLKALEAGAREFLTKPFDRDEALMRIKNLLKSRLRYERLKKQKEELARMVDEMERSSPPPRPGPRRGGDKS